MLARPIGRIPPLLFAAYEAQLEAGQSPGRGFFMRRTGGTCRLESPSNLEVNRSAVVHAPRSQTLLSRDHMMPDNYGHCCALTGSMTRGSFYA